MNDIQKIRALVQQQQRPEKVVPLVLRADIQSQIEDLEKQLIEIQSKALESLAGNPEAIPVADRIDALIEEAKGSLVEVRLRALPRKEWSDLVTKHPSKDGDYLYDAATIFNDAIPACWVSPELDAETLDKLLEGLTQGQFDRLAETVQQLNRGEVKIPFSALATRTHRDSVASEK